MAALLAVSVVKLFAAELYNSTTAAERLNIRPDIQRLISMPLTLDNIIGVATTHTKQDLDRIAQHIEEAIKIGVFPISQQHSRMERTRVLLAQYLTGKVCTVATYNKKKGVTEEANDFIFGFYIAGTSLISPTTILRLGFIMKAKINPRWAGNNALEGYEIAKGAEQLLRDEPSGFSIISEFKEFPTNNANRDRGIQCFVEQYTALYNRFFPQSPAQSASPHQD